jgi:enamine deaminase RidA (YjgF/YER057c/UK114 family)
MTKPVVIVPKGMEFIADDIGYAPAVLAGNTLYISGQIGRDDQRQLVADKEAQFVQVFENMKRVLAEAGCSFENLVEMTSYLSMAIYFDPLLANKIDPLVEH